MIPQSRNNLINWCLRRLGWPVVEIDIDDEQIEDRIDEGLMMFRDYHFDGVERLPFKHQITGSCFNTSSPFLGIVEKNDILKGVASNAEAWAFDKVDNSNIRFKTKFGTFQVGETVTNQRTGEIFTIASIFIGDVDNKYIEIPDRIISIFDIVPLESSAIGGSMGGMFDFQYQFALHNMFNLASTDLITYQIYKQYQELWSFLFRGKKGLRFNRKMNRVFIDVEDFMIDTWVVLECWAALDPEEFTEIYSDEFVREYCYNLLKLQWGINLSKFSGVVLPGGITLDGYKIKDEAETELNKLRERLRSEFELPATFIMG